MTQKIWFVTGASRGFGAEIAKAVLASGDKLIATARRVETLEFLGRHDNLLTVGLDVTEEKQAQTAAQAGVDHFGRIDVLVNNAGYGLLGAVEESSAAEVEAIYRTNVFGLLNVTRAVLPSMRKQRPGRIMNFSSIGGYAGFMGWGAYGSTKFAVEGLTEAMHMELTPLGIYPTVVEPGFFRTNFLDSSSLISTKTVIADYGETVGKMREFAGSHNHQQPGDPRKLAQAIIQLANAPVPPQRLPLGTGTLKRIAEKNAFVETELNAWRDISASTDL